MRLNLESILRNRVTIFIALAVLYLILLPAYLYSSGNSIGTKSGSGTLSEGLFWLFAFYDTGVRFYTAQLPEIFFAHLIPFDALPKILSKILTFLCHIAYWGGFLYFMIMIKEMKKRNLVISFIGIILIFSLSVKGCVDMQFHKTPQAHFAVTPLKGVKNIDVEENFDYSISPDNKWLVYLSTKTEGKQYLYFLNTVNLETGATAEFVLPERKKERKRKDFDSFYVTFNISYDGWTKNSKYFAIRDKGGYMRKEEPAGFLIDFTNEKLPNLVHNYLLEEKDKIVYRESEPLTCSDCPTDYSLDHLLMPHLSTPDGKKEFYIKKFAKRSSLYESEVSSGKARKLTTVVSECPDIEGFRLSPDQRYLAFTENYLCSSFLRSDPAQLKFVDLTTKRIYFVAEGIRAHWDSKSEKIYFMDGKGISWADVSGIAKEYPVSEHELAMASEAAKIEATIKEFGTFDSAKLKDSQFVHIDPWVVSLTKGNMDKLKIRIKSDKVIADIGTSFGIRYRLKGDTRENIVITTRILTPGLKKPDSQGETIMMEEWEDNRAVGEDSYEGFIFLDDYQLVPGKWTIQLFHEERKLAEKDFEISKFVPVIRVPR